MKSIGKPVPSTNLQITPSQDHEMEAYQTERQQFSWSVIQKGLVQGAWCLRRSTKDEPVILQTTFKHSTIRNKDFC